MNYWDRMKITRPNFKKRTNKKDFEKSNAKRRKNMSMNEDFLNLAKKRICKALNIKTEMSTKRIKAVIKESLIAAAEILNATSVEKIGENVGITVKGVIKIRRSLKWNHAMQSYSNYFHVSLPDNIKRQFRRPNEDEIRRFFGKNRNTEYFEEEEVINKLEEKKLMKGEENNE